MCSSLEMCCAPTDGMTGAAASSQLGLTGICAVASLCRRVKFGSGSSSPSQLRATQRAMEETASPCFLMMKHRVFDKTFPVSLCCNSTAQWTALEFAMSPPSS